MYAVTNEGTRNFLFSFSLKKVTLGRILCKDQSTIKPIHIGSQQKEKKESVSNNLLNRHLDKFKKISKIAILKRQLVTEIHVHLTI